MTAEEFKTRLRQVTFWDVPIENLDVEKNKRQIIERVFSRGEWPEIKAVIRCYRELTIIEELKMVRSFDDMTLNFVSKLFHIPLNEFRCYDGRQSDRNYWGF